MHTSAKTQIEDTYHGAVKETDDEMHRIMTHGHKLLEEKAAVILGMKDELRRTSEHYNKVTEMQTIGQREAEMKYKDKLYELQAQFEEKKRNLSE